MHKTIPEIICTVVDAEAFEKGKIIPGQFYRENKDTYLTISLFLRKHEKIIIMFAMAGLYRLINFFISIF
jgi:hypothetical protein